MTRGVPISAEQERLFVLAYVRHWNGSRAALEAGWSKETAGNAAWRLLKREDIQRQISEAVVAQQRGAEWSAEEAAKIRAVIARATIQDFADVTVGNDPYQALKNLGELGHAVRGIDVTRSRTTTTVDGNTTTTVQVERIKLYLWDKHHAIDQLEGGRRLEPPKPSEGIDLRDLTDDELAEFNRIVEAVIRRREAKAVELQATEYQETGE
ncbi:MAG: terminase small subunit [Pseudomonadota bacterium]|nr:terminase small subunit [Pseudomonadota bacterium]